MGKKDQQATEFDPPADGVHTLEDLEQVRVLADPLRVRILELLCEEARTTKQVAKLLDEKPTRLYHHVEALERVGLIRLAGTRQNRGTTEKYYVAIARAFRADASIFSGNPEDADDESQTMQSMVSTILQHTGDDLSRLIDAGAGASLEKEGVLGFLEINATEREVQAIQAELLAMIERMGKMVTGGEGEEERKYRFTLAYFPLDRSDKR